MKQISDWTFKEKETTFVQESQIYRNTFKHIEFYSNQTFFIQDLCIRVPVLKLPTGGVAACRARKSEKEADKDKTTDPWDLDMTDDFTPFWEASNNATDGRSKREVEQQPGVFSSLYGNRNSQTQTS